MTKTLKINLLLIIALFSNGIVFVTTILNSNNLSDAHSSLSQGINDNLSLLTDLQKLEHTIGYVGFIHKFKNFVLRSQTDYYHGAIEDYNSATKLIQQISTRVQQPIVVTGLTTVQNTLDYYRNKLEIIATSDTLSVLQRDELARVDDNQASQAIDDIIYFVESNLANSNAVFIAQVDKQIQQAYALSVFVALVILSFTYLVIRFINTQKEALNKFNELINASPDAIVHADSSGQILSVNSAATKLFEYSKEEFARKTIEDLLPKELAQKHKGYRHHFDRKNQSREMNAGLKIFGIAKSGHAIPLQIAIGSFTSNQKKENISIIRDMRQIEGLNKEKDYLTDIINGLTAYVLVLNAQGEITDMNQSVRAEIKEAASKYLGKPIWLADFIVDVDSQTQYQKTLKQVIASGQSMRFDSQFQFATQPVEVDVSVSSFAASDSGQTHLIISAINISDRVVFERQLSQSEANFKQVISQTSDVLIVLKANGDIAWSNKKGLDLFNCDEQQLHQLNLFTALSVQEAQVFQQELDSLTRSNLRHSKAFKVEINNGQNIIPVEVTLAPYNDSSEIMYLATISDLSELLASNAQLENLLEEKNTLLNEVHHRVKNNLQVINSLLQLQQHHVVPELADELRIYQQRIRSVALVHQLLYEQDEFSSLDFVDYLSKLAHLILLDGFDKPHYAVNFDLPPHQIYLPIKLTVPMGLIVNEVLTNIIKHAFDGPADDNLVIVKLELDSDAMYMEISDNGKGMDEQTFNKAGSLGHTLIELFTKQAFGSYVIDNSQGTKFSFTFNTAGRYVFPTEH